MTLRYLHFKQHVTYTLCMLACCDFKGIPKSLFMTPTSPKGGCVNQLSYIYFRNSFQFFLRHFHFQSFKHKCDVILKWWVIMGLKHILSQFVNSIFFCRLRWFSVSRLEYNEAYVKNSRCLIGGKSIFQKKNPLQDLHGS